MADYSYTGQGSSSTDPLAGGSSEAFTAADEQNLRQLLNLTSTTPYYDDYDELKQFVKILFRPGRPVQARELTQIQTLLQQQIDRFGSHVFKDGSGLRGGAVGQTQCFYVRVENVTGGAIEDFIGHEVVVQGSDATSTTPKAKVLFALGPGGTNDPFSILFVQFTGGNGVFTGGESLISDNPSLGSLTCEVREISTDEVDFDRDGIYTLGEATLITLEEGVYFMHGYFLLTEGQTIPLYSISEAQETENSYVHGLQRSDAPAGVRLFSNQTAKVGLRINGQIISADDDETLKDPANGFYNYNAPGADRLQIKPKLIQIPYRYTADYNTSLTTYGEVTKDFIELMRIENGVTAWQKSNPVYNNLGDTMARRTYDESGSYTVDPFEATVLNHLRKDRYQIYCDTGVTFTDSTDGTETGTETVTTDSTDSTNTASGPIVKIGDVLVGSVSKAKCTVTNVEQYTAPTSGTNPYPNSDTIITVKMSIVLSDGDEVQDGRRLFEEDNLTVSGSSPTQTITTIDKIVYQQDGTGVYSLGEGGDEDLLACQIGPGKAYVYGYEHELLSSRSLPLAKGRDTESVTDYNLVANIGNYINVTFPDDTLQFGNWSADNFSLNAHPVVNFSNSKLTSIEFPFEAQDSANGEAIYWAPLKATEHDANYNSVLFIGADPDGTPSAACNDGSEGCFKETPGTTITGASTGASYRVKSMSGQTVNGVNATGVRNNIRKIVFQDLFNEGLHYTTVEDIVQNWTEQNQLGGFTTQPTEAEAAACDAVKVYQIDNSVVEGNHGGVMAQGIAWRWVPASATGSRSGSVLFVEELHGTFEKQSDTGDTEIGLEVTGGVIFQRSGNLTTYGSSVKEVQNIEFVQQLTSSTDYNDTQIGTYEVGDKVRQSKVFNGEIFYATGTVIGVAQVSSGTSDTDCDKIRVWIEVDGSANDVLHKFLPSLASQNVDGVVITNVGPLQKVEDDGDVCIEYNIADGGAIIMGEGGTGKVQKIIFRDPYISNAEYKFNAEVKQFNPFHAGEHASASSPDAADPSLRDCISTVISWNSGGEYANLYVSNTQNEHRREYGAVFQMPYGSLNSTDPNLARQGGAGIQTVSNKNTGFFVDFEETYGGLTDAPDFLETETVTQLKVDATSTNYIAGKDYPIGGTVTQGEASGTVVAWETRDATDATDQTSSILTLLPTSGTFVVGSGAVPIVGATPAPGTGEGDTNYNSYPTTNAKIVTRVMGRGRLRQFTAKDNDEFFAHFYDIKMNEFPNANGQVFAYEFSDVDNFYPSTTATDRVVDDAAEMLFRTNPVDGVTSTGKTKIFGTLNRAIFPLPVGSVAESVYKADYRIQKSFKVTFTGSSNATTVGTGSANVRFVGGTGATNIVDGLNLNHYMLIAESGQILDLTQATIRTNNNDAASDGQCTIDFGTVGVAGITATLIATLDVNPATVNNQAVLSDFRKKTFSNNTASVNLTKNPVTKQWEAQIPYADIKNVTSVKDSSGATITDFFEVDDGKTDNLYDWTTLTLLPKHIDSDGNPKIAKNGDAYSLTCAFTYFVHSGEGPIYPDSYTHSSSNIIFDNIPMYISKQTGDAYPLNTSVDCRPIRATDGTIQKTWMPKSGEAFDVSYSYYLGRYDKLIITNSGEFDIIKGIPSLYPVAPSKIDSTMDLYVIKIPPYTFNAEDCALTFIENKRYTMRDIGALEKRITALEYYTSLSMLEKETEDLFIDDGSGNNRFKLGTLVDNFTGHSVGDVRNPDYNCSIDRENNHLRCRFTSTNLDLEEDTSLTTALVKTNDGLYHLPFSHQIQSYNPVVTTIFNLNPFEIIDWQGKITLSPANDNWVDTERGATVRVNLEGENDNWDAMGPLAMGTDWNDWQTTWTGTQTQTTPLPRRPLGGRQTFWRGFQTNQAISRTTTTTTQRQTRTGVQTRLVPERVTRNLGDRVVDMSIAKFIRARNINFTAHGLKPNTNVFPYFDEVMVAEYCTQNGVSVAKEGLVTDENGSLSNCVFAVPAGKFLTGQRVFKLMDDKNNQQQLVTTSAEADFQASGIVQTKNSVSITTRTIGIVRQNVTESRQNVSTTSSTNFINVFTGRPSVGIVGTGGGTSGGNTGTGGGNQTRRPTNIFTTGGGITRPRRPGARPCPALAIPSAIRRLLGGGSACTPTRWRRPRPWNIFRRGRHRRSGRPIRQRDPLAQTFFVSAEEHPDGIYITKLDLWFKSKGNVPIDVQIRPVVNGYPHATAVLPFGQEVIQAADVTAMGDNVPTILDSANATTVTFQTPIHLMPGQEYAIVLIANSTEYEIYGSTMGQSDLNTGDVVSKQPTLGSLFKSQNSMTWEADQKSDLMYVLYHAEFDTTTSYDVVFKEQKSNDYSGNTGKLPYDLYNLNCNIVEHDTAFIDFAIAQTPNTAEGTISDIYVPFAENENIDMSSPSKVELDKPDTQLRVKASFGTQNVDVTPMIDMERFGMIMVNNIIDNNNDTATTSAAYNGELDPQASLSTAASGVNRARYCSRQITLNEGFEASNVTVMLTQNRPAGTDVQVFLKVQKPQDDRPFDKMPYVQLEQQGEVITNPDEVTFSEVTYKLPTDTTEPFNKYSVKIVLYSGNTSIIPKVKDLRAISVL